MKKNRQQYDGREMRPRIRMGRWAQPSINRRLEELNMDLSEYIRWLVEKDIGVKV
jgi:hypothetical protein